MTTDYTLAPATELVATRCAICNRELLDVVSVETGVGPTCRKRHGYGEAQGPALWPAAEEAIARAAALFPDRVVTLASLDDARRAANALVHRIAADPHSPAVPHLLAAVSALGFVQVADAISANLVPVTVRVEAVGTRVLAVRVEREMLRGELFERFVEALRAVPGRWFDRKEGANMIPAKQREALWGALKASLPEGTIVRGSRIAVL